MSVQVPKGYKQTEVGVIPEDWELSALEKLADPNRPISYGIVQTGPNVLNGIKCLRVVDIENGKIKKENLITTTKEISDSYKRTILKKGDLVIPLRGKVGEVGLIEEGLEGSNLTRGVGLIALRKDFDSLFFKQNIASIESRRRLEQSMNGSALQEIPIATLRAFKIAYPKEVVEQQAIAEALSDADALIESLEQLIAKKRQIKQGAMQELLTGQRRLPGFSGEWSNKCLGDLGVFLKGAGVKKDEALSGNLPCIRYGEIYTKHHDWIRGFESWISQSIAATATKINYGDVLFAASGETKAEIGKSVSYVDQRDAYAGGDIIILRTKSADPLFLGYYLNTEPVRQQKSSRGQGDAVVHIVTNALAAIKVALPSMEEQKAIATVLSDMDIELSALESRLDKARQIKQSMMQELLTGRIRLI